MKGTGYLVLVAVAVIALAIVGVASLGKSGAAPPSTSLPPAVSSTVAAAEPSTTTIVPVPGNGDSYEIPVSALTSQIQKHTVDVGGKKVRFLAVLGSDGRPRTAFDGCVACGTSKGFTQSGGDLVCSICGKHFPIDDLGSGNLFGNTCEPIYLANTVSGGKLLLKLSDLAAQKERF